MNCMKIAGTIINFEIDMSTQMGVRDYSIDYSDYSAYPVVYLSFESSLEQTISRPENYGITDL